MAKKRHIQIIRRGRDAWNEWRAEHPSLRIMGRSDLSGVDLSYAELPTVDFYWTNLKGANLSYADLNQADLGQYDLKDTNIIGASLHVADVKASDLTRADLTGTHLVGADFRFSRFVNANLSHANLRGANLTHTNLTGANLSHADLAGANLNSSTLTDAIFTGANIGGTILIDNDLSTIQGLESVTHESPSHLGLDTLYKSAGRISVRFLIGCGVPDDFVDFIPSYFGLQQAIQFYSCFISYSSRDEGFAKRLYSRMRDEHLRVWFAPEDVRGGRKLHEQIERAIQVHDRLLIVLSENSMQSEWVITEIRNARKIELEEKRRKLFPIRLVDFEIIRKWKCFDAESGKDLAIEVREYFIPDFSNWKDHDAFEVSFKRLLRDLKPEE
jgi:hypothetical protein